MIAALLLDLDDTLLDNPSRAFVSAYLNLLANRLADFVPTDGVDSALRESAEAMIANQDPERTLRQAFEDRFLSRVRLGQTQLSEATDQFLRADHANLKRLTQPRPEARAVVQWALDEGLQVTIATNPVFPLAAIQQRLEWANVGVNEFAYAFVPSYETMHFAKPWPEFFAELAAMLGRRPAEVMMVGDDWERDIAPASLAGVHTYWIAAPGVRPPMDEPRPDGRGSLADFLHWVRDGRCLETVEPLPPAGPAGLLAGLTGNLGAFITLSACVIDWKRQPAEGEWSLTEILCHLRDVEVEVNLPRLQRLVSEEEPFVHAADTDPWARERNYQAQDGEAALRDFARARRATTEFLRACPEAFWSRPARHSILGRTTPAELVTFTLEHDRIHQAQIRGLLDAGI